VNQFKVEMVIADICQAMRRGEYAPKRMLVPMPLGREENDAFLN
jgi:hypothetical protein